MSEKTGLAKSNNSVAISGELYQPFTVYENQALLKLSKAEVSIIAAAREKKFATYTDEDKQKLVKKMLAWMVVLAIKEIPKADDPYWVLIANFLIKAFPLLTLSEFDAAIEHNIKRVSEHKERHFQGFGADYLSIMINLYLKEVKEIKFKFNQLAANIEEEANRRVPTAEEKQIVQCTYFLHLIEQFKNTGRVNDPTETFLKFLKKSRKDKVSEIDKSHNKHSIIEAARERIKKDLLIKREGVAGSLASVKIRTELKNLEKGSDTTTEDYVISQAVNMYCEIILSNINIDELKNEIQTEKETIYKTN